MKYDPQIIRKVESLAVSEWEGIVYRHVFGKLAPDRENTRGARWNPPETRAIYCTLLPATAIAEGDYVVSLQPVPPTADRRLHKIEVKLARVVDLANWQALDEFGVESELFAEYDFDLTQAVGGAVERLGCDGMLVPSARHSGTNLVIFPRHAAIANYFQPISSKIIIS